MGIAYIDLIKAFDSNNKWHYWQYLGEGNTFASNKSCEGYCISAKKNTLIICKKKTIELESKLKEIFKSISTQNGWQHD